MDLIIRDARRRHREGLADIGIAGGRFTTPSFVEPHIPLDKALTAERARENATNVFGVDAAS